MSGLSNTRRNELIEVLKSVCKVRLGETELNALKMKMLATSTTKKLFEKIKVLNSLHEQRDAIDQRINDMREGLPLNGYGCIDLDDSEVQVIDKKAHLMINNESACSMELPDNPNRDVFETALDEVRMATSEKEIIQIIRDAKEQMK